METLNQLSLYIDAFTSLLPKLIGLMGGIGCVIGYTITHVAAFWQPENDTPAHKIFNKIAGNYGKASNS